MKIFELDGWVSTDFWKFKFQGHAWVWWSDQVESSTPDTTAIETVKGKALEVDGELLSVFQMPVPQPETPGPGLVVSEAPQTAAVTAVKPKSKSTITLFRNPDGDGDVVDDFSDSKRVYSITDGAPPLGPSDESWCSFRLHAVSWSMHVPTDTCWDERHGADVLY